MDGMMFSLFSLVAIAAPVVSSGSSPTALSSPPSLTILYSGEQRGEIGPCGCDAVPRGGLGRLASFVEARAAAHPERPQLLLDPGAWLSSKVGVGALTEAAVRDNIWFNQALEHVPFDALNVTPRDMPSLSARSGLVSANLRAPVLPSGVSGPAIEVLPYTVVQKGEISIAITGVSLAGLRYLQPQGTEFLPPVDAVRTLLPELQVNDLVVVMVQGMPKEALEIAQLPGIDVVIDAAAYMERWPLRAVGDAVLVRSRDGGASVGILDLWLDEKGLVVQASEDTVRLSEELPSHRQIDRLERLHDKEETRRQHPVSPRDPVWEG